MPSQNKLPSRTDVEVAVAEMLSSQKRIETSALSGPLLSSDVHLPQLVVCVACWALPCLHPLLPLEIQSSAHTLEHTHPPPPPPPPLLPPSFSCSAGGCSWSNSLCHGTVSLSAHTSCWLWHTGHLPQVILTSWYMRKVSVLALKTTRQSLADPYLTMNYRTATLTPRLTLDTLQQHLSAR